MDLILLCFMIISVPYIGCFEILHSMIFFSPFYIKSNQFDPFTYAFVNLYFLYYRPSFGKAAVE